MCPTTPSYLQAEVRGDTRIHNGRCKGRCSELADKWLIKLLTKLSEDRKLRGNVEVTSTLHRQHILSYQELSQTPHAKAQISARRKRIMSLKEKTEAWSMPAPSF